MNDVERMLLIAQVPDQYAGELHGELQQDDNSDGLEYGQRRECRGGRHFEPQGGDAQTGENNRQPQRPMQDLDQVVVKGILRPRCPAPDDP